jgi:hypothetical protein
MKILYKIVGFDKPTGTMMINYYSAEYAQGMVFHLTLPIENGTTLSGQALDDFIMFNAPRGQMEAAVQKLNEVANVDFSHIESLVELPVRPDVVEPLNAAGTMIPPVSTQPIQTSRI